MSIGLWLGDEELSETTSVSTCGLVEQAGVASARIQARVWPCES